MEKTYQTQINIQGNVFLEVLKTSGGDHKHV